MKLILSRHGNTFEAGDKVVWVGRRTDLPLTAEGRRQALHLGNALCEAGVVLGGLYCGPLRRTHQYANLIAARIGHKPLPIVDSRLAEIDYGAWEGLSSQEIIAKFGRAELEAWEGCSTWPASSNWSPSEATLAFGIRTLVEHLARIHEEDSAVLAVTSNGVLRYFLRLADNPVNTNTEAQGGKVATGHICILEVRNERCRVHAWNIAPDRDCLSGSSDRLL
ncbi:histidine phosphatase family protein [Mesorhizobium sp. M5C.F.Cr.IN.023.01.1.1]|uniref:histidine phosphatase family protein n=1 Tax=Mesorhizobium sp. M5C.F.Cr.IN.023.01.1.1 TaxID=2496768 RepID=UPI000FC9C78E|nr:histidine phosphatase family protein [Mesorhizobium sp. M5C.F.Cr.IN.023.01.1.1]RUV77479.1 histidine phosphatase family protein [Mesorhizobium sp. M5C.F.Cr.IN.023.01.1.1]